MEVKTLQKQLLAAIAMVLVALIALASATYAWFVSNNTVKATTATISAQSNAPFLKIDTTTISETSGTAATQTATEEEQKLYPAQWASNFNSEKAAPTADKEAVYQFESAYAQAADAATILDKSRFAVGDESAAVTGHYAMKQHFVIGTNDEKAGSFKDLKVSGVEIGGTNSALTTGLKDAITVLIRATYNDGTENVTKWGVYNAAGSATPMTAYADSMVISGTTTATTNALVDTLGAGKSATVDVYVFYDGSSANVYTNNIANLNNVGMTITFTATPVSTTGAETTGGNAV